MNQWQQLGDKYMEFITVERAEQIIQSHARHFGVEEVFYEKALGRILAENLFADRDLPPFNRPTVDGIAINFDAYKKVYVLLKYALFNQQEKYLYLLPIMTNV